MTTILIFVGLITLLGIAVVFVSGNSEHDLLVERIERIRKRNTGKSSMMTLAFESMSLRRKNEHSKGFIYWLTKPLPDFKRIGQRLEWVGKTITPKQYVLRRALLMVIITLIGIGVFKKPFMMSAGAGYALGVWLPLKFLDFTSNKKSKAFLRSFPDALNLIVRGLRSGLPVSESLVLVVQEVPGPVSEIFGNIANVMKLGVSLEKALQETARRLDMTEFNFFTTSIILQRETGGNLSEILNNLSEVLRNRFMMRVKIKAMCSEARASAYIIGSLPFLVFIFVMLTSPDYMTPLWTDPRGIMCAYTAAGMMFAGIWLMNRMAQFEI